MRKIVLLIVSFLISAEVFAGGARAIEGKGSIDAKLSYLGVSPKEFGDYYNILSGCGVGAIVTLGAIYASKSACWQEASKTATVKVSGRIYVVPWGEGKAKIGFKVEGTKGCAGFQGSFTGIQMASGGYELFTSKDDVNSLGEAIVLEKAIVLNMKNGLTAKTAGKSGHDCDWFVSSDTNIEFNR